MDGCCLGGRIGPSRGGLEDAGAELEGSRERVEGTGWYPSRVGRVEGWDWRMTLPEGDWERKVEERSVEEEGSTELEVDRDSAVLPTTPWDRSNRHSLLLDRC